MDSTQHHESDGDMTALPVDSSHVDYDDAVVLKTETKVRTSTDESIANSAKASAKALKDLVEALAQKTKETAIEKTRELKVVANDERPGFQKDAADIQRLGSLVDKITTSFEETLGDIQKTTYEEQERLLIGLKKLLAEEINVINARLAMATRLTSVPAYSNEPS